MGTSASLVNVRYGNGGSLVEPVVDKLVWALMVVCCASAYLLNFGVVAPVLEGDVVNQACLVLGLLLAAAAVGVVTSIHLRFSFSCDMEDPTVFHAYGVPFVPALAMFFNFFLISTIPQNSVGCFGVALAVFLVLYAAYAAYKGEARTSRGGPSEQSDTSNGCDRSDSGRVSDNVNDVANHSVNDSVIDRSSEPSAP